MRIVAISDLHGNLPAVPPCDLLVVGGDICPDRYDSEVDARLDPTQQERWLRGPFAEWMASIPLPASHKLFTWGNHDFVGEAIDGHALAAHLGFSLVQDEVVSPGGLRVWMSPWSNPLPGEWAFVRPVDHLRTVYDSIPPDVDILVSHQPPFGHGDLEVTGPDRLDPVGSKELLAAIERVRPQAVICGHIQRSAGVYAHQGVPIYNVSILDGAYVLTHPPTILTLAPRR